MPMVDKYLDLNVFDWSVVFKFKGQARPYSRPTLLIYC